MERFLVRGYEKIPPGAADPRRWSEAQLLPHAGSMSSTPSPVCQFRTVFHKVRGGIYPDDLGLRSWVVGVVEIWKDL